MPSYAEGDGWVTSFHSTRRHCRVVDVYKRQLFGLTGNGSFDMAAYMNYFEGHMENYAPTDEELQKGFDTIPVLPGIQES